MASSDDLPFRHADTIVSGPYVGWLIDHRGDFGVLTKRDFIRLPKDAPMRAVMSREEAQRAVDALCRQGHRGREGSEEGAPNNAPPDNAPPDNAPPDDALFAELAWALTVPERALRSAIKRKDPSLTAPEAPWVFNDHEYLGAFRVESGLIIADRCYVDRTTPLLAVRTPALAGTWHAYVRTDQNFPARTVGLLVVHEDHIDVAKDAGRELGFFGVDAGCAVVVDMRVLSESALVHELTQSAAWDEGLISDAGCFGFTYDGDGVYRARGIERDGAVVAVRVNLTRDEAYDYHKPPPAKRYTEILEKELEGAGPAKPYSPSTTFAVGDRVAHKKFGEGVVRAVRAPDKVEIAFADEMKTLIHGKK